MLYNLAPFLTRLWGPFRLLTSHLLLMGIGMILGGLVVWYFLPRLWNQLPRDRGRLFTPTPGAAQGKPTGAGLLIVALLLPVLFLVAPLSLKFWKVTATLCLAMLFGFLDDRSSSPWGEYRKGLLDLLVAGLAGLAFCEGRSMDIWLPVLKHSVTIGPLAYVAMAACLLWLTMNATNCSDGVDGLAGTLTLLSLFHLGAFLYVVVGHRVVAQYLLVPHNPEGAQYAVLLFVCAGGLGGYLWFNAEPSRVLMGDAGSRFLGLLVGVAVLAAGNPFLILVVAPVVLANGGTGLVKIVLLRLFKRLGFDISPTTGTANGNGNPWLPPWRQHELIVRALHRVRFPLHDHCRKVLGWSNAQVLMRFVLIQSFLAPILMMLLVKVR